MKKVSKYGHELNYIYARARVRALIGLGAAVLPVLLANVGIICAGDDAPLQAKEIKASLQTEKNPLKRNRLYEDLARVKGTEAETLLKDNDPKIRKSAVLAIGNDKEYSKAHEQLRNLATKDSDLSVRTLAIQSMGVHQEGMQDLQTILENETEPLPAREAAASALALFSDQNAAEILITNYNSSQKQLKEHLRICLAGLRARFPDLINDTMGESDEK